MMVIKFLVIRGVLPLQLIKKMCLARVRPIHFHDGIPTFLGMQPARPPDDLVGVNAPNLSVLDALAQMEKN